MASIQSVTVESKEGPITVKVPKYSKWLSIRPIANSLELYFHVHNQVEGDEEWNLMIYKGNEKSVGDNLSHLGSTQDGNIPMHVFRVL